MDDQIDKLIKDFRKPFTRAARKAEQALVRLGDHAVEPVAELLFSESLDTFTQSAALNVLEQIGTPRVIPHMLRLVKESRYGDHAATRFLARRRDPALLAALLEVARSGDEHAATAALTGLAECQERSILPDVCRIINARVDKARSDAIRAASRLGGREAFDTIAPLLRDPNIDTRWAAAGALASMGYPQAARHLADALKAEENESLIRRLAGCLLDLKAADLLPVVFEGLKRVAGKSALHGAIARVRGGTPTDIAPYLKDPEADVRIAAAIALGNSESIQAVVPLLAARTDAEYEVRQAVRRALKSLKRSGVLFSMPHASVRDRAVSVLELLAAYFRIPSSEGFSAYRTGWVGHLAFSVVAAATLYAIASTSLRLDFAPSAAAAIVGVILLWGVGIIVGVCSHYNPLIMIAAVGVIFGSVVLGGNGNHSLVLGLLIAGAAHTLMTPVAFLLKLLRKAVS